MRLVFFINISNTVRTVFTYLLISIIVDREINIVFAIDRDFEILFERHFRAFDSFSAISFSDQISPIRARLTSKLAIKSNTYKLRY